MNSEKPVAAQPQRQVALSSWENEGGAPPDAPQAGAVDAPPALDIPVLSNAELVQLRVRVIALENVIIALLSKASDEQLRLVGEVATLITPRPGFTPHPLTMRASTEMLRLVDRAIHFRGLAAP